MAFPLRVAAMLLVAAFLNVALAAIQVEHSFDGATFLPAGKLVGNVLSDSELAWERPGLSAADRALLEKAAKSNGLYSVRVRTAKSTLLTSVPAACLTGPVVREQAEIDADRNGALVAFNYAVPSCSPAAPAAPSPPADLPARLPVRVVLPRPGPMLLLPEMMGEFADVAVDADFAVAAGAYDPTARPRAPVAASGAGGAAAAAGGKGRPPPPDERSWLQKNWLFVLAGGMMVLNVLAKANAPAEQAAPGAGARPAVAGGGAPRR